jgi:CheY-like chemotaxis protein
MGPISILDWYSDCVVQFAFACHAGNLPFRVSKRLVAASTFRHETWRRETPAGRSMIRRVLLIEDDEARQQRFRSWLPRQLTIVWARSAGQAIGLLRRDRGEDYLAILLDHDLQQQTRTAADSDLSGSDALACLVAERQKWSEVPILVHSMNPEKAPEMVERLEVAGFWVERAPFVELTRQCFLTWLADVIEDRAEG